MVETQALAKQYLYQFDVVDLPDSVATAVKWLDEHKGLQLVENLTRKATVIAKGKSGKIRDGFLNRMVKDYVEHVTYHLRFLYDKRTRLGKPLQPSPVVS